MFKTIKIPCLKQIQETLSRGNWSLMQKSNIKIERGRRISSRISIKELRKILEKNYV